MNGLPVELEVNIGEILVEPRLNTPIKHRTAIAYVAHGHLETLLKDYPKELLDCLVADGGDILP